MDWQGKETPVRHALTESQIKTVWAGEELISSEMVALI